MTKKKWLTFIGIGALLLTPVVVYWFYFAKPDPFLTNEQLLKEMNSLYPEYAANVIQDTVQLEKHHVFVPFISKEGKNSLSFWVWKHHKWKLRAIDNSGYLQLWKIDKEDPTTYHFVWNIPSQDQISYMKMYLIKKRQHYGINNILHYNPEVQMEQKFEFGEKTYGSLQMPNEWATVIASITELNAAKQIDSLFHFPDTQESIYFGWNTFDELDTVTYPDNFLNGSSSWNVNEDIEHIMRLNESDLEYP